MLSGIRPRIAPVTKCATVLTAEKVPALASLAMLARRRARADDRRVRPGRSQSAAGIRAASPVPRGDGSFTSPRRTTAPRLDVASPGASADKTEFGAWGDQPATMVVTTRSDVTATPRPSPCSGSVGPARSCNSCRAPRPRGHTATIARSASRPFCSDPRAAPEQRSQTTDDIVRQFA